MKLESMNTTRSRALIVTQDLEFLKAASLLLDLHVQSVKLRLEL